MSAVSESLAVLQTQLATRTAELAAGDEACGRLLRAIAALEGAPSVAVVPVRVVAPPTAPARRVIATRPATEVRPRVPASRAKADPSPRGAHNAVAAAKNLATVRGVFDAYPTGTTMSVLKAKSGFSHPTVMAHLRTLIAEGAVHIVGSTTNRRYVPGRAPQTTPSSKEAHRRA